MAKKKVGVSANGVDETTIVEVSEAPKRKRREPKVVVPKQSQPRLSHNTFRFSDQLEGFLKAGTLLQSIEDLIVRQFSFCDRTFAREATDEKRRSVLNHTLVLVLVIVLEFLRKEGSKVALDTARAIGASVSKSFPREVLEGFISYRFNYKPTYKDAGLTNLKAVSWARHQIGHVLFDYVVPALDPDDGYELAEVYFRVAELEGFDPSKGIYQKYNVWFDANF